MTKQSKTAQKATKSQAQRNAAYRSSGRVLLRPRVYGKIQLERERLERDAGVWMRAIFPRIYRQPFGMVHHELIEMAEYTIENGGRCVGIAPRGTGKSYVLDGCALRAVVRRKRRFPVVIPWASGQLKKALGFWKKAICFNAEFARLYPEWVFPFVESRGTSQRCATYTDQAGKPYGAQLLISEGMIVFPDSLAVIAGTTLNGNPLGLQYTTDEGEGLRPDLVFVDDPQDRDTALSAAQIRNTIAMIDEDIAGMAGPDQDEVMPIMMAATKKQIDDVADHYSKEWRCVCIPQITAWPKNRKLWDEWNAVRQDGEHEKDKGVAARAFYEAHKAELLEGFSVSWEHRFSKKSQPDAFYAAMYDYYSMGHNAFMSERQNEPVQQGVTLYTLTPDVICSRATTRPAGVVPEWSRMRIAATDINPSYGLTWGVVGFGADQTAAVLAYGIHAMQTAAGATEAEVARAIYEALVVHGRQLAAMPCRPEAWVVDAGGAAFDTVHRFAAQSVQLCGIQCIPATGRGAKNYRETGRSVLGKPREKCHMATDLRGRKWIAWHADYWREAAQKAWTGSVGAPGSCSLPVGHHREFAEQICREQLAGKAEVGGLMMWRWVTQPGPHDFGDVMAMAYMGAAWSGGIGTQGTDAPAAPPKARVFISRPSARR